VSLSPENIKKLIDLVATTRNDALDCDGCLEQIAEFAEARFAGRSLSLARETVRIHLESCGCCQHEYKALLDALGALGEDARAQLPAQGL